MKNNYENFQATEQYRTLSADLSNMPFSFVYDGRKYQGFSPEHFTLISKDTIRSDEKETYNKASGCSIPFGKEHPLFLSRYPIYPPKSQKNTHKSKESGAAS